MEYLLKILLVLARWNMDTLVISFFFSLLLSYVYYRFHKSKHISHYKESLHNAKKDYNKAIENLALKYENELKHQENKYLSQLQLLNSEITTLNNEKTQLMVSLNTANLRAEFNIARSQNHE